MALRDLFRGRRAAAEPQPLESASPPHEAPPPPPPPIREVPPPPPYQPEAIKQLKENFDRQLEQLRTSGAPQEAISAAEREFEKARFGFFPEIIKRLRQGEALNQEEIHLMAEDLVRNRFEASAVSEKIASVTGKKNIRELMNSRELLPRDVDNLDLAPEQKRAISQWWERSGWVKRAFGKSATTGVIGLGIGVLSGGWAPMVFGAGLLGATAGNLAVEKWRSVAERKYKKQEVQALVNNALASVQAANRVVELRKQGVEDQVALNDGAIQLVDALQKTSGEALEARKQLSNIKHQAKWALVGLGGSVAGAAIGVSAYELLSGGFKAATAEAMATAKQTGETFKVRNHDVRFVHDAWRWLLGAKDPQHVLRAISPTGETIQGATTGMAHASELWKGGVGVASELAARVQEQVYARVVKNTFVALMGGLIFGEGASSIWRAIDNASKERRVETGAKKTEAAFGKTRESVVAAKTRSEQEAEVKRRAEEAKPKAGNLYYAPSNNFTVGDKTFTYDGRIALVGEPSDGNVRVRLLDNVVPDIPSEFTFTLDQLAALTKGPYHKADREKGFSEQGYTGRDERYKTNLGKLAKPGEHYVVFFKGALAVDPNLGLPSTLKERIKQKSDVKIRAVAPPDFGRDEIVLEDEDGRRYVLRLTLLIRWTQFVSDNPVAAKGTAETAATPPAAATSTEAAERPKIEPKPKQIWGKRDNPQERIVVDRIDEEDGRKVIRGRLYDRGGQARAVIQPIEDYQAFLRDYQFINDFIEQGGGGGGGGRGRGRGRGGGGR